MKLPGRRRFLHLAAVALGAPAILRTANAQAYPARPARIVLGFTAGDAHDIAARLDVGATVFVNSPSGFAKHIADETEKWGKVVRTANLRAD